MNEIARKYVALHETLIDWDGILRDSSQQVPGLASIIIPMLNNQQLTRDCIESLYRHAGDDARSFEVIVVDNGSTDGSPEMLQRYSAERDNFRVLTQSENLMFAMGCNVGVAAARGEFVVLLNNDTIVTPGWLTPLVEPLASRPEIAVVGPKILNFDDTLQGGAQVFNALSAIPSHIYAGLPGDHPAVNKARRFQSLTGACMALRRRDFVAARGFDPMFMNGCEDADLCFRLRNAPGNNALYNPASVIYHHGGRTEGRGAHILRNRELFVDRWGGELFADDKDYYAEDGFAVLDYESQNPKLTGRTALFNARLAPVLW